MSSRSRHGFSSVEKKKKFCAVLFLRKKCRFEKKRFEKLVCKANTML
jgi:hypothetical protein